MPAGTPDAVPVDREHRRGARLGRVRLRLAHQRVRCRRAGALRRRRRAGHRARRPASGARARARPSTSGSAPASSTCSTPARASASPDRLAPRRRGGGRPAGRCRPSGVSPPPVGRAPSPVLRATSAARRTTRPTSLAGLTHEPTPAAPADHGSHARPGAAGPALAHPARGVARGDARGPPPRHLAAHRAVRAAVGPRHRDQGDRRDRRVPRVRAAAPAAPPRRAVGRAGRCHHRSPRARRRAARGGAHHQAPAVLAALPLAVQPVAAPRHRDAPHRRARRAARAPAPRRLLLGRRVAVEHPVPTRRGDVRRVPRRRRDG